MRLVSEMAGAQDIVKTLPSISGSISGGAISADGNSAVNVHTNGRLGGVGTSAESHVYSQKLCWTNASLRSSTFKVIEQ